MGRDIFKDFMHGMSLSGKKEPLTKRDIKCLFNPVVMDQRWEWKDRTLDDLNLSSLGWTSGTGIETEIWTPDYKKYRQLYTGIRYPGRTISSGAALTVAESVKNDPRYDVDIRGEYTLLTRTRIAFRAVIFNEKPVTQLERVNGILLIALAYSPHEIAEPPEFEQYRESLKLINEMWHNPEQKKT